MSAWVPRMYNEISLGPHATWLACRRRIAFGRRQPGQQARGRACSRQAQASRQQMADKLEPGQMLIKSGEMVLAACMPRCADSFASHEGSTGPNELVVCTGLCVHTGSGATYDCSVMASPQTCMAAVAVSARGEVTRQLFRTRN
jgi:hypothetical protein